MFFYKRKREVPRGVRNSKVRRQDKPRREPSFKRESKTRKPIAKTFLDQNDKKNTETFKCVGFLLELLEYIIGIMFF